MERFSICSHFIQNFSYKHPKTTRVERNYNPPLHTSKVHNIPPNNRFFALSGSLRHTRNSTRSHSSSGGEFFKQLFLNTQSHVINNSKTLLNSTGYLKANIIISPEAAEAHLPLRKDGKNADKNTENANQEVTQPAQVQLNGSVKIPIMEKPMELQDGKPVEDGKAEEPEGEERHSLWRWPKQRGWFTQVLLSSHL